MAPASSPTMMRPGATTWIGTAAAVLTSAALLQCGSSSDKDDRVPMAFSLNVPEHVAANAEVYASLSLQCPPSTVGCRPPTRSEVSVIQASVDDPTVFDVGVEKSSVRLRSKREGATTLQVEASALDSNGSQYRDKFTRNIDVRVPDRVELTTSYSKCATPLLFATGASFEVRAELWSRADRLEGDPTPFPVTSDLATLTETLRGRVTLQARSTRGIGTVQSTLNPEERVAIELFEPEQITALTLEVATTARLGALPLVSDHASFTLTPRVTVGTREPCEDMTPLKVTSTTPSVCTAPSKRTRTTYEITTLEPGLCTLEVEVGSVKATQSVEVRKND